MSQIRQCSCVCILAVALLLLCQAAWPQDAVARRQKKYRLLYSGGPLFQDIRTLTQLAPLQLTSDQIDAILQVLEDWWPQPVPEVAQELEQLRARLLRSEQLTTSDLLLLKQAYESLEEAIGETDRSQQALAERIRTLLTPQQQASLLLPWGPMLGPQQLEGLQARVRRDAEGVGGRAGSIVRTRLRRLMNDEDPERRRETGEALLETIGQNAGGGLDEAGREDLGSFFDRVLAMDWTQFTEIERELYVELGVLLPTGLDPCRLDVALELGRIVSRVSETFLSERSKRLLEEMREARADVE